MTALVFGLLLAFLGWTLVEQLVLWLHPAGLARFGFLPLARASAELSDAVAERIRVPKEGAGYREGAMQLDPAQLEWPREVVRMPDVEISPPAPPRRAWFRVGSGTRDLARAATRWVGAGRIAVWAEHGALVLSARWYPGWLIGTAGCLLVLIAVVLALAPWHVGLVLSAILVGVWLVPAHAVQQGARARLSPALAELAERLAQPTPKATPKKRAKKGGRTKKGARRA